MTLEKARELLKIAACCTGDDVRAAFRMRAKEIHPDVNDGEESHLAMIELNQARNIVINSLNTNGEKPKHGGTARTTDYHLYKSGMELFKTIHPSLWTKVDKEGLFNPSAVRSKTSLFQGVTKSLHLIEKAYSLFSEVVIDYPESMWYMDCIDKLATLDKMAARYKMMKKRL